MSPSLKFPPWARLVLAVALAKVALGTVGSFGDLKGPSYFHPFFYTVFLTIFGAGAILLVFGGREDRRAVALGSFFAAFAAAYAKTPLSPLAAGALAAPVASLQALRPDMFLPYFLWRFVRDFPDAPPPVQTRRLIRQGVAASAWAGASLFLLGVVAVLAAAHPLPSLRLQRFLAHFNPNESTTLAYFVITPLIILAFAVLARKGHFADAAEQRRTRLFITVLCALLGPIFLVVLVLVPSPSLLAYLLAHPALFTGLLWAIFIPAWLAPCAAAYAALVHQVLGIKLIARQALRYALARYTTILLATMPLLALAGLIYSNREKTVKDLLSGPLLPLLVACAVLGAVALRYRKRLLEAIDRRFFREQYDARNLLAAVLQRTRTTRDPGELAEMLCRGLDQALHLETIGVLIEDPRSGSLVDPRSRARRLDSTSPLAQLVASASDPLAVDLDKPRSVVARLPEPDRHWLVDCGFRLIVPILARDGSLLGLIGLGEKRSGLPFLKEDKKLLEDIARTAAPSLELELKHGSTPIAVSGSGGVPIEPLPPGPGDLALEPAKECVKCGTLYPPYWAFCGTCSKKLDTAPLPYMLPGKFRFERRIGIGGMGLVYRGVDLALGRPIAAKTLRRVSPEDAMRLRREARTAALVSHPNLAAIYGVETWQGTPMLILEFLEGGTLTQRMDQGPIAPLATVELGIAMAGALDRLHAADVLHRDIKPSNIGFTRDGVPKLMDFGIARVMLDLRREDAGGSGDGDGEVSPLSPTWVWGDAPTDITASQLFAGTLSYLSPEALAGQTPDVTFDLWGLCLVLYECLIGRKLSLGATPKQVRARLQFGRIPDLEQFLPDVDRALADFFRAALHRSFARRPASARELRRSLEEVRLRLDPQPVPVP